MLDQQACPLRLSAALVTVNSFDVRFALIGGTSDFFAGPRLADSMCRRRWLRGLRWRVGGHVLPTDGGISLAANVLPSNGADARVPLLSASAAFWSMASLASSVYNMPALAMPIPLDAFWQRGRTLL